MTMTLTQEKKQKILEICQYVLHNKKLTIRDMAILLGNLTSAIEAVPYAKLNYRSIECSKIIALKQNKGNFEAPFQLSEQNKTEITWWQNNIKNAQRSLNPIPIDKIMFTDASKKGWGAIIDDTKTGGEWLHNEKKFT